MHFHTEHLKARPTTAYGSIVALNWSNTNSYLYETVYNRSLTWDWRLYVLLQVKGHSFSFSFSFMNRRDSSFASFVYCSSVYVSTLQNIHLYKNMAWMFQIIVDNCEGGSKYVSAWCPEIRLASDPGVFPLLTQCSCIIPG